MYRECHMAAIPRAAVRPPEAISAFRRPSDRAIVSGHNGGRAMAITMYDLAGTEADRRFSPFCWRARMALAHKGLAVETVPWRVTGPDKLPQPNERRVPVIVDDGQTVFDSTAIADYLESRYADRPSLFGGANGRA